MTGAEVLVGPALKLLLMLAKEMYKINSLFEPLMKELIDMLEDFEPLIKEVEKSENSEPIQNALRGLQSKMDEGQTLMEKCSKVTRSKVLEKRKRNKELVALQKDLQRRLNLLSSYALNDLRGRNTGVAGSITGSSYEPPDRLLFTIGLDKPLEELKMWLRMEGEAMLVLTAPGGFGKTTLATEFCHDQEVIDKFQENIFFVRVSKNPNLNQIIQKLHQRRRSLLASTSQNIANAVNNGLHHFLKEAGEKPLLVVLDDVWCGSESLIEKFHEVKMPDYKILVTTRSEFPRFGSSYHLKSLRKTDARTLFNHLLEDRTSHISTVRKEKMVEHCKGHPLAIKVVGSSLCGKPDEDWKSRELQCSGGSILDSETQLLECLQTSLDALDKERAIIKRCFIDLGVFLHDQTIPASALIDIWSELHELEAEELKDKDCLSIAILHKLIERSLADLVFPRRAKTEMMGNDGYYSQHFVAQHDLLRQLAIRQPNEATGKRERLIIDVPRNTFPKWWTEQMYHQPVHARLVSISTDEGFSEKWDKMNLPKAEVLVLNFQAESYALPKFLKKMSNSLKVLIVTNHGLLHAKVSKLGLLDCLSNLKRIRLEGISISSIKKNFRKLESLQKISLFMCNIDEASSQILVAFPNLVEMNIDYCNNLKELPAKFCGLVKLKKLSITNCDKLRDLPEQIGNLVDLEVLRLLACINLLQLPGSISRLKKLKLLDISDCWSIERLPDAIVEMRTNLEKLKMIHCPGLRMLGPSISNLMQKMDVICDAET